MTGVWITIAALALGTMALKLAGPLLLGGRAPAGWGHRRGRVARLRAAGRADR
jgi:hypothetical protein